MVPRFKRVISKLRALSGAERRLLLVAGSTVLAVRIGLYLLPFRRLHELARRPALPPARASGVHAPERIAWAVAAAARLVPRASCLTQAVAAQRLLERAGHPVQLRMGVGKDEGGGVIAHAWVERDGTVLIGDIGLEQYTPLPALPLHLTE